jgi:hypothetical protein
MYKRLLFSEKKKVWLKYGIEVKIIAQRLSRAL